MASTPALDPTTSLQGDFIFCSKGVRVDCLALMQLLPMIHATETLGHGFNCWHQEPLLPKKRWFGEFCWEGVSQSWTTRHANS